MTGLFAYALGGALQGFGGGLKEQAIAKREAALADLANQRLVQREEADRAFRREEGERSRLFESEQHRMNREFQLDSRQGDLIDMGDGKFGVRKGSTVEPLVDTEGNPAAVNKKTGRWMTAEEKQDAGIDQKASIWIEADGTPKSVGGSSTTINMSDGMKLTEQQSKDIGFYARGKYALHDLRQIDEKLTSASGYLASQGGVLGNYFKDADYQVAEGAGRDFLAIVLRKDTGAAVTPGEFDLYGKTYLPWPGDDKDTIEAKRKRRDRVLTALRRGLGTASPLADNIDQEFKSEISGDGNPGRTNSTGMMPQPGDIVDGYRFIGGDPGAKTSWQKVQ